MRKLLDPNVVEDLGIGVVQEEQVNVVLTMVFGTQVFHTVPFVVVVQGYDVYAYVRVLSLEFRDVL